MQVMKVVKKAHTWWNWAIVREICITCVSAIKKVYNVRHYIRKIIWYNSYRRFNAKEFSFFKWLHLLAVGWNPSGVILSIRYRMLENVIYGY